MTFRPLLLNSFNKFVRFPSKPTLCALYTLCATTSTWAADRPNILWITSEDNGPHYGCYGDEYATTPNIDALSAKSLRYTRASSNAPVCAPARTTIIAGLYPTSTGGQHMRSSTDLPKAFKTYPELLREAGYYCTNNSKTDYNYNLDLKELWDESSRKAHWKNRPKEQPFFAIFNHTISHESKIRNGIDERDRIHDPAEVRVPAYHPDTCEVRKDWAQYYDRLTMLDTLVGKNLKELEDAGLADDTIVFHYGDHGSGMPRSKRFPYFSGLNVPMIVHFPEKWRHLAPEDYVAGGESTRLVSFVDLAPTLLSVIGYEPSAHFQGHAFAGDYETESPSYSYGFRGRMDGRYDLMRTALDGRYIYIRNYAPHRIYGQYVNFMFVTPTTQNWYDLYHAGKLNEAQSHFWKTKPAEELYDLENDPDEVNNLASSLKHSEVLLRLREAHQAHMRDTLDLGFLPEGEIHSRSKASTPYEMARDGDKYPFEKIFAAAELAASLAHETGQLTALMEDDDSAVRYWGALGLLMRGSDTVNAQADALRKTLADQSPYVRIVAAEALGRYGNEDDVAQALTVLKSAARPETQSNFVCIAALTAIDHMDKRAAPIRKIITELPQRHPRALPRTEKYIGNLKVKILEDLDGASF